MNTIQGQSQSKYSLSIHSDLAWDKFVARAGKPINNPEAVREQADKLCTAVWKNFHSRGISIESSFRKASLEKKIKMKTTIEKKDTHTQPEVLLHTKIFSLSLKVAAFALDPSTPLGQESCPLWKEKLSPSQRLLGANIIVYHPEGSRDRQGLILLRSLQSGTHNSTKEAYHLPTAKIVVLRELKSSMLKLPGAVKQWSKEMKTQRTLQEKIPGIVKILEIYAVDEPGNPEGTEFIPRKRGAMLEYCHGDLCDFISQDIRLIEPAFLSIFYQLLETISLMHKEGWKHRDIKPENILYTTNSSGNLCAKLADFGAARETKARCILGGTLRYIPLDLKRKSPSYKPCDDLKIDSWALGLTAYEIKYGVIPQHAEVSSYLSALRQAKSIFLNGYDCCCKRLQEVEASPVEQIKIQLKYYLEKKLKAINNGLLDENLINKIASLSNTAPFGDESERATSEITANLDAIIDACKDTKLYPRWQTIFDEVCAELRASSDPTDPLIAGLLDPDSEKRWLVSEAYEHMIAMRSFQERVLENT